jgi:hypothetical protein
MSLSELIAGRVTSTYFGYIQETNQLKQRYPVRLLSSKAISMLECFFIMSIIEAYSFHAENELETEGLIEEQPYARAILKAYLNVEPFLFQVLDE